MARWTARVMAPIALAAVAIGAYLIVHANTSPSGSTAHTTHTVLRSHHQGHHAAGGKGRAKTLTYTVKAGDTLSEISSRTGVSITKLAALNPKLSPPYNLQAGQRLRLRR